MNTRDSFRSHETKVDNREDRLSHGIGVAILPYFSNPPPPRSSGRRGKSEADGQDAKNKTWPHNSTNKPQNASFWHLLLSFTLFYHLEGALFTNRLSAASLGFPSLARILRRGCTKVHDSARFRGEGGGVGGERNVEL